MRLQGKCGVNIDAEAKVAIFDQFALSTGTTRFIVRLRRRVPIGRERQPLLRRGSRCDRCSECALLLILTAQMVNILITYLLIVLQARQAENQGAGCQPALIAITTANETKR